MLAGEDLLPRFLFKPWRLDSQHFDYSPLTA